MRRIFGLETEYGITVDGAESVDVVAESIELVRGYTEHGALMKWDYDLEDPHRDARGFRVPELLQDTDESAYFEIDRNRPLSFEEIKSDLVLGNEMAHEGAALRTRRVAKPKSGSVLAIYEKNTLHS